MKMNDKGGMRPGESGVTLIELIVILTIASIMGIILVQFLGSNVINTATIVTKSLEKYSIAGIAEQMTADYERLVAQGEEHPLEILRGYIENGSHEGNSPYYGEYTQNMKYIAFDNGTLKEKQSAEGTAVLKVVVTKGDHTIVLLFTE